MATAIARPARRQPLAPDRFERVLAGGAIVLLACIVAAVARGRAEWALVPALIWLHLAAIVVALGLTPVLLLRPRGDRRHRRLGQVWAVALIATAFLSLFLHGSHSRFSVIHILSAATLVLVPRAWWAARTHRVAQHRSAVRGIVAGALLIAGFFTFPFDRLLGHWLFG